MIWNGDTHGHSSQLHKNVEWFGTAIHISSLDWWGQQICSHFGSTNTATTQTGTATICKMSASTAPADVSLITGEDGIFEVFLLVQFQFLIFWAKSWACQARDAHAVFNCAVFGHRLRFVQLRSTRPQARRNRKIHHKFIIRDSEKLRTWTYLWAFLFIYDTLLFN